MVSKFKLNKTTKTIYNLNINYFKVHKNNDQMTKYKCINIEKMNRGEQSLHVLKI